MTGLPPGLTLRRVDFETVAPLAREAARERVAVTNTAATTWLAVYDGARLVGCGGVLVTAGGQKARVKGIYMKPELRGRGVGSVLTQTLLDIARNQGVTVWEAYAHAPAWYLRRGFTLAGKTALGVPILRKTL